MIRPEGGRPLTVGTTGQRGLKGGERRVRWRSGVQGVKLQRVSGCIVVVLVALC